MSNRYLGEHNRKSKPFVWTADPDRVIEKVNRGHQAIASDHYVDGTASTPVTTAVLYSNSGNGIGSHRCGTFPLVYVRSNEVLFYFSWNTTNFSTTLGASNVATLRSNQRSVFGF